MNWTEQQPTEPGPYWITNYVAVAGNRVLSRGSIPIAVVAYRDYSTGLMHVAWAREQPDHRPFHEPIGAALTENDDTGSVLWQRIVPPTDAPEPTLTRKKTA